MNFEFIVITLLVFVVILFLLLIATIVIMSNNKNKNEKDLTRRNIIKLEREENKNDVLLYLLLHSKGVPVGHDPKQNIAVKYFENVKKVEDINKQERDAYYAFISNKEKEEEIKK
jgi:cbb3-type cytochrome oxidase subunit 3